MDNSFLTGEKLPDMIFQKNVTHCLAFEFEFVFGIDFLKNLQNFCENNQVKDITILSLDDFLPFRKTVETPNISTEYFNFFETPMHFEGQSQPYSLHSATINFSITTNNNLLGLYVGRGFELAVLGFDKSISVDEFRETALHMEIEHYFELLRFKKEITAPVVKQLKDKQVILKEW